MGGEANCVNGRCFVPGGTFIMGSRDSSAYFGADQKPARRITISPFWMSQKKITVGEFQEYYVDKVVGSEFEAFLDKCIRGVRSDLLQINPGETLDQFIKRTSQISIDRQCGKLTIFDRRSDFIRYDTRGCFPEGIDDTAVCLKRTERQSYCKDLGGNLPTAAQYEYSLRHEPREYGRVSEVREPSEFGIYGLLDGAGEYMRDTYDPNFYSRMSEKDPYNTFSSSRSYGEEIRGYFKRGGSVRPQTRRFFVPGGVRPGFRCVWPHNPLAYNLALFLPLHFLP